MSSTVECVQCGALNEEGFGRCIRCNLPLHGATPADRVRRRVPAPRVHGKSGRAVMGPGAEPFLGRFPAETLPATKLIVLANLVVLAGQLAMWTANPSFGTLLLGGGSTVDAYRSGALFISPGFPLEVTRLLSACFVHFGILHAGMNLWALVHLGRMAEPAIGSVRLILTYVLTGVAGYGVSVGYVMVTGDPMLTAGASGAVFGVMGLVLGFLLRRRDERWKVWLGQAVLFSVLFGFVAPVNVNNSAHLGGLAAGFLLGLLFAPGAPRPSRTWQRVFAALCAVAVVASLVLARFAPIPGG